MLNAYSVDVLVITQSQDHDDWGEPLPELSVNVRGYVEWKTRLVRNLAGEEVTSTIKISISKRRLDAMLARPLSHEDRINSINGAAIDRAILAIHQPKAFSMPHYEVYLA